MFVLLWLVSEENHVARCRVSISVRVHTRAQAVSVKAQIELTVITGFIFTEAQSS